MANINVRVVGTANVTQMSGAFAKLQEEVTLLNTQLKEMVVLSKGVDPSGYERMARAAAVNSKVFRNAAASTGMFEVQQLRLNSATDEYVKKLNAQKLSFRDMIKQQQVANAAYREQLAMQDMIVRKNAGATMRGKGMYDVVVPSEVSSSLDTAGKRLAFMNAQLKSGSQQLINWGKNTQWAGRQLMVGFTMPIAAFGAAAGVMAYQIDQQFTRVKKVYDTTADQTSTKLKDIMAVQQEFNKLQQDSMATAQAAAQQYGVQAKDTLAVQAELAATGQRGAVLQKATAEVVKNAMLGEIDYNTTTKATIALQQTLHMNTKQLADTWAYMNSVENATSLSMADFAQAIPIAMGPLKQMGGTVQTLGTLLTGMVSRGIQVGKAANAIKAAAQRLIRPSKQVQEEFAQLTGYDITKIAANNKGNLLGMLQDIYTVTKNLDQLRRQKVFAGLFGSYQLSTMSAMVNSMGDLQKGIGQVAKAQEIGQQSAKQWGDVQRLEINQMQQSMSGQFKRALATLQVSVAEVGKPFVEVTTVVIKGITKIVQAFNGLPDWAKWSIAGAAAFAAIAGPIVMLAGLFANLVGNLLKFGSTLAGTFVKMELFDKESKAMKLASQMATSGFASETSAIQKLTLELQALTSAWRAANAATRESYVADLTAGGLSRSQAYAQLAAERRATLRSQGRMNSEGVSVVGGMPIAAAGAKKSLGGLVEDGAKVSKQSEKISSNWKAAGGSMLVAGGAMAAMTISGNKAVDQAASMVLSFSMLAPMFSGLPTMMKSLKAGVTAGGTGMLSMAKSSGSMLLNFAKLALGPTGLLAIAAVGIVGVIKKIHDANSEQQKFNDQADNLSKIYGYQATQIGQMVNPKTGQAMETLVSGAQKMKDTMPDVVDKIKEAYDIGGAEGNKKALDLATNIGLQVKNSGGTAAEAQKAVRDSLYAAIGNKRIVYKLMAGLDVNFKVNESVIKGSLDQVHRQLQDMINNAGKQSFDEMMFNGIIGRDYKGQAADAAKAAGQTFVRVFNAQTTKQGQYTVARMMTEQLKQTDEQLLKQYESTAPKMAAIAQKNGITRMSQLDAYIKSQTGRSFATFGAGRNPLTNFAASPEQQKAMQAYLRYMEGVRMMADKVADKFGVQLDNVQNIDQVIKAGLLPDFLTLAQAQKIWNDRTQGNNKMMNEGLTLVTGQVAGHTELNKSQKLTLLNNLRMRQGLEKTGTLADGFNKTVTKKWNPSLDDSDKKVNKFGSDLDKATRDKNVNIAVHFSGQDYVNILQQGMQGVQQSMADDISANFDKRMQGALDARQKMWDNRQEAQSEAFDRQSKAMDARFEREQAALDAHWQHRKDAAQKYWDNQVKNVEREIDAEQKADDKRQKMFEAEIARINALNEAANRNIDFNVALNSGKLDEAAKIRNDVTAAASQTALQNASEAGSARAQARIDRLNKRRDKIQERADAYMKRLDRAEAHAQAMLKKREEAERAHLEKVQKMRAAALKEQADADMKAQQEEWDRRKKTLDLELSLFTSYIAKNKADLKRHMKDVGLSYKDFGDRVLKPMGLSWSEYFRSKLKENIHKAGLEIASDKMWKTMGGQAAKQVLDEFGFENMAQFKQFIKTGNMPAGVKDKAGKSGHNYTDTRDVASQRPPTHRHEGGWVGGGKDSRKGVARNLRGRLATEVDVRAKEGEFMVNEKAAAEHGDLLEQINSGKFNNKNEPPSGGFSPGPAAMVSALMTKMLAQGIAAAMSNVGAKRMAEYQARMATGRFGVAKAGKYGDMTFTAEQLKNASIIAGVGKKMGMSARDIEIGIMTAITESTLRNLHYGDRDSQGLFQQRPSMGWGTVAQVTNPEYASHTFFEHLKRVGNRTAMSPWMAAQTVQGSAFSSGSNYAQYWNEAQAIFKAMSRASTAGGTLGGVYVPGKGGRHRPVAASPSSRGIHDAYTGYPALDFPVPVGTPVYAVADGTIARSEAITGGGSPGNGTRAPNGQAYTSYGEVIYLHTNAGPTVLYAHLSKRGVAKGAHVRGGSVIGRSGNTGNSTGPHLHFGSHGASPYAWLKDGGHTLNEGLAMLHPQETVLTKPLSADLQSVVSLLGATARAMPRSAAIASGGNSVYNLKVIVEGSNADADEIAEKVMTSIKKMERRKPQSRRG